MNVAMPQGNSHGWGIAGTYLTSEIAKLPPIPGVTLHCVAGHNFAPSDEQQWDRLNIGYCFFEHEVLAYRFIPQASRRWDHIVAGSSWCEHHLRIGGCEHTSTILQGIDPAVFQPLPPRPDDGRFIVFSGGKFEFRKGHDVVMAAMRIFMARHSDAWLACAWHNHWPNSIRTMAQSRLIDFRYEDLPCQQLYLNLLAANGIDPSRVVLYPVRENRLMKSVYGDSDIGLFPNRCEGGNNMVMCEYMACGRPVIASTMTGHRDVVASGHALCLASYEPVLARTEDAITGIWFEPDVEEIVEQLEYAYRQRSDLHRLGAAAGAAMTRLSWVEAAKGFHALAESLSGHGHVPIRQPNPVDLDDASAMFEAQRYPEAERAFRTLLIVSPLDPDLHNSLATVLDRLERFQEAILHYEKALALRPSFWVARFNLANTLKRMGDGSGAIEHLEAVVSAQPAFVPAWQNLALCCFDQGAAARAAECLERVLNLEPSCSKSRIDLGDILIELGRYQEAVRCFDDVLDNSPEDAGVLNSKGNALQELDDLDGAESCYRRILSHDPDNILALNNLGTVLRARALPMQAIDCFDKALAIVPGDGPLIFNRSLARLAMGDFNRGWSEYENRFEKTEPVKLAHPDLPRWDGTPHNGTYLLVQAEQGYGDTLQFVRYLPLLTGHGVRVVFEAQDSSIKSAVEHIDPAVTVLARGEALPPIDFQVPLLSLPGMFGTDLDNIPFPEGYLAPDPVKKSAWQRILGPSDGRLRIGLVWGGRKPRLNSNRSMTLKDLEPLLHDNGMRCISLQLGDDAAQLSGYQGRIEDMRPHIGNFADTAALVSCLDFVVSIDSAVAHLGGALGVPTLVMLKYAPDWRWFLERNDSPWYTSALLFRQQIPGDWAGVASSVHEALKKILPAQKKY